MTLTREQVQRAFDRVPPRSLLDACLRRLDDEIHTAAILIAHGEKFGCPSKVLKDELDALVERRARLFLASVEPEVTPLNEGIAKIAREHELATQSLHQLWRRYHGMRRDRRGNLAELNELADSITAQHRECRRLEGALQRAKRFHELAQHDADNLRQEASRLETTINTE